MNVEQVLKLADRLVFAKTGNHLDDLQQRIVRGVCQGQRYSEIAREFGCTPGHVRDVGSQLWKTISDVLGENVSKNNFRATMERIRVSNISNFGKGFIKIGKVSVCAESFQSPQVTFTQRDEQASEKNKVTTDTWVTANWDEFIQIIENPAYQKAKGYYYNGKMKIETMPVGCDRASQHGIMTFAINLFCTLKNIPHRGLVNCSYRRTGVLEAQPDTSYYLGEKVQSAPTGTSIVALAQASPPNLAIEIADTIVSDHKGEKRLLYEELKVDEYWVVDVQKAEILAFEILADGGSRRIYQSQALPGLAISLLEEALERSRQPDQAQVGTWLLTQFQQM